MLTVDMQDMAVSKMLILKGTLAQICFRVEIKITIASGPEEFMFWHPCFLIDTHDLCLKWWEI